MDEHDKSAPIKKRGSVLVNAGIAVLIVLAGGMELMRLGSKPRACSARTASDIAAREAVETGLAMALSEMNQKLQVKPYSEITLPQTTQIQLPHSHMVCGYTVKGNLDTGYSIESTGTYGRVSRTVRAVLALKGAFSHAILTRQTLILKPGTTVDGYNSLDPFDTNIDVCLGSQSASRSSVILNQSTTVKGSVFVADNPDAAIEDRGATITGIKYASVPEPLPRVTAPVLLDKGAISATGQTIKITPANSGTYSSIDLQPFMILDRKKVVDTVPAILEVSGGAVVLHVTGDIQLDRSCEIVVAKGASLTIYADGNIYCHNGSGIDTENPPDAAQTLQIYATGSGVQFFDIRAKSQFTGLIYAPEADVDLSANGDAYGAVIARDFEFKTGGNFHYDEALQKKNTINDEAVQFVVNCWFESPPILLVSGEK